MAAPLSVYDPDQNEDVEIKIEDVPSSDEDVELFSLSIGGAAQPAVMSVSAHRCDALQPAAAACSCDLKFCLTSWLADCGRQDSLTLRLPIIKNRQDHQHCLEFWSAAIFSTFITDNA